MNMYLYGAVLTCMSCIAAIVCYERNKIEKQKRRLIWLETEYKKIETERKTSELENGADHPECQELMQREAGMLVYIMTCFPRTYLVFEPKLMQIMARLEEKEIA